MKERPEFFDPDRPDDNKLYTTKQVADLFSVTSETVREWIKTGRLKGLQINARTYRIRRRDLIDFANSKYGMSSDGDA